MGLIETPAYDENWHATNFSLPNLDKKLVRLDDVFGKNGAIIAFICNHCPFVQAIIDDMVLIFNDLKQYDMGACAIMSNDAVNYPADSPEKMQIFAKQHHMNFPYLYDETQEVAKSYDAVCTPDFFGFNAEKKLRFRGRIYEPNKRPDDLKTSELFKSMQEIAQTGNITQQQFPSMGCSIKWSK